MAPIWGLFYLFKQIMSGFILGEKADQSQQFTEDGKRIPVTTIKAAQCFLIGITPHSVRLGYGATKNINKPQRGELKKAGIETPLRFFNEFRLYRFKDSISLIEENGKKGVVLGETKLFIGDVVKPSVLFRVGDKVDVTGVSKGKGFQGVVRRHRFAGGPKTHGQSDRHRAPGSIGASTTPGRVYKGKRMAGRMGGERVTLRNLEIVATADDHLVVSGLVPGYNKTLLKVASYTEHAKDK